MGSRLGCLDGAAVAGGAMGPTFLPLCGGSRSVRSERHGVISRQGRAKGLACRVARSLGRTRCAVCGIGFLKVWILPRGRILNSRSQMLTTTSIFGQNFRVVIGLPRLPAGLAPGYRVRLPLITLHTTTTHTTQNPLHTTTQHLFSVPLTTRYIYRHLQTSPLAVAAPASSPCCI